MFLCDLFLPSFASRAAPRRASQNQVTSRRRPVPGLSNRRRERATRSGVPVLPAHGQPEPRSPPWSSRRELEGDLRRTIHRDKTNFCGRESPRGFSHSVCPNAKPQSMCYSTTKYLRQKFTGFFPRLPPLMNCPFHSKHILDEAIGGGSGSAGSAIFA